MARTLSRIGAGLAMAASLSTVATPAFAQGWGGNWGGGHQRHRHHDGGSDAGAIIAGLLVIGGIAAIAASSSKNDRERNRERDYRYPNGGYPDGGYPNGNYQGDRYPGDGRDQSGRYGDSNGDRANSPSGGTMNTAVDACVSEVESGSARVETVDSVNREGGGWRVEGRTAQGQEFGCSVSNGGSISRVTVDGRTR